MARSKRERMRDSETAGFSTEDFGAPSENPATGQSGDSEVAMDIYGGQETTITEVIKRAESVEDPEPGAPNIDTKVVNPTLPKDIKIVDPEDKVLKIPPPPVNPPLPTPEFITEEIRTFKPIYSSFSAQIVEVINKNTVKLDVDFNQKAQEVGQVEGDYQGTDPRGRLTYNVVYPNFKIEELKYITNKIKNASNNELIINISFADEIRSEKSGKRRLLKSSIPYFQADR